MFNYYMPTNINFGKNCLDNLSEALKSQSSKNILIFIGNKSAFISGALKQVTNRLSRYKVAVFKGICENPSIDSLTEGLSECKRKNVDTIIAIGGGSVIDYAKAVSFLSGEKGDIYDFFHKKHKVKSKKLNFIAIPTTFGTSSEITPYVVMTDKGKQNKVTLFNERMFPDYAFIDPSFTITMPESLVAVSCVDLLSHAVEAYWNINSTELTDNFAKEAIKLFLRYYKKTFKDSKNIQTREKISLASIYAGFAFSNTRTTACHSISYPMTTIFNIPHGIACALTLAEVLGLNAKANRAKISSLCSMFSCSTVAETKKIINKILDDLNIKRNLSDYGLCRDSLTVIANKGFTPERMNNNPYKMTKTEVNKLLEKIY